MGLDIYYLTSVLLDSCSCYLDLSLIFDGQQPYSSPSLLVPGCHINILGGAFVGKERRESLRFASVTPLQKIASTFNDIK